MGITHSPITDNVKNIQLEKNPNPKDNKPAFVRPKASKDRVNNFKKKEPGWSLSKNDKQKIDKLKK